LGKILLYFGSKSSIIFAPPPPPKKLIKTLLSQESESAKKSNKKDSATPEVAAVTASRPSNADLYRLAVQQGLPFVGFGFLMIVAGESIETFLGASLVISTMAAAALGNTLSDVFGIGSVTGLPDARTQSYDFYNLQLQRQRCSSLQRFSK
jgi:hypothetical protein